MSALLEAVIPDSIEPVEAYRCWTFERGELKSLNGGGVGEVWTPGKALTAKCNANHGQRSEWRIVRNGMSRGQAEERFAAHQASASQSPSVYWSTNGNPQYNYNYWPAVPAVEPPDGYGFELEVCKHHAPDEACTCGIYAATNEQGVPGGGNVYGKVKLWGKVVPGDKGYRAEFAYPSEFRVSPDVADDAALRSFGVPIVVDDTVAAQATSSLTYTFSNSLTAVSATIGDYPRNSRARWLWWAAVAANLVACAAHITLVLR